MDSPPHDLPEEGRYDWIAAIGVALAGATVVTGGLTSGMALVSGVYVFRRAKSHGTRVISLLSGILGAVGVLFWALFDWGLHVNLASDEEACCLGEVALWWTLRVALAFASWVVLHWLDRRPVKGA